jgi:hypothetical protein
VDAEQFNLQPPASLAPAMQKIIADRRALADELAALDRAAEVNDQRAIRALGKSKEQAHRQLTQVATATGIKACAQFGAQ